MKRKMIQKKLLFNVFLFIVIYSNAQTNAVTEYGDQVILNNNGTWNFITDEAAVMQSIEKNSRVEKKSPSLTFLVKSKIAPIGIYINPQKWSFKKGDENDVAEFTFQKKGDELYGLLITEKMSLSVTKLVSIARDNAKSIAPDLKVIQKEYILVNGLETIMMQMEGTIEGIKYTYYGYYYSNSKETIQLLTYTPTNLFDASKSDIEEFMNGLVNID